MTPAMECRLMQLLETLLGELRIEQNRSGKLIANRETLRQIAACVRQTADPAAPQLRSRGGMNGHGGAREATAPPEPAPIICIMPAGRHRMPASRRHRSTQTPRKVAVATTAA